MLSCCSREGRGTSNLEQWWANRLGAGVGVHLSLATGEGDVHETASVCESLLGTALGGLGLLLLLNLGGLRLDLASTGERSVNLSHFVEFLQLLRDADRKSVV